MQTPAKVELRWFEGATNNVPFALYQDEAHLTPVDITGVRWVFEAREGARDSNFPSVIRKDSAVDGEVTTDPLNGAFTFNVSVSDSTGLPKKLFYNVFGIWPDSGPTLCYFEGLIVVSQSIADAT